MATTARMGDFAEESASAMGAISSPLLRPPAISTTDLNPLIAAAVAWGVVALESLYHSTPPPFATS